MCKIVLCGEPCSGKSTWTSILRGEEYSNKYIPSCGVEVTSINGVQIWDSSGNDDLCGDRKFHFDGSSYIILMFKLDSGRRFRNVQNLMKILTKLNKPILICGCGEKSRKKSDNLFSHVQKDRYLFDGKSYPYFEISNLKRTAILEPLNYIFSDPDVIWTN